MRHSRDCGKIGIMVLLAVALCGATVHAGTSGTASPPTDGPKGLAIQRDAQGQKLYGVMTIEFYNVFESVFNARIFARLRSGNLLKTVSGQAFNTDTRNLISHPEEILNAADVYGKTIQQQILDQFFPGIPSLTVVLKNLTEYAETDVISTLPSCGANYVPTNVIPCSSKTGANCSACCNQSGYLSSYSVADIEIAVK